MINFVWIYDYIGIPSQIRTAYFSLIFGNSEQLSLVSFCSPTLHAQESRVQRFMAVIIFLFNVRSWTEDSPFTWASINSEPIVLDQPDDANFYSHIQLQFLLKSVYCGRWVRDRWLYDTRSVTMKVSSALTPMKVSNGKLLYSADLQVILQSFNVILRIGISSYLVVADICPLFTDTCVIKLNEPFPSMLAYVLSLYIHLELLQVWFNSTHLYTTC